MIRSTAFGSRIKPCRHTTPVSGLASRQGALNRKRSSFHCQAVFGFGQAKTKESKYANDMSRDEYTSGDVEDYFNYMGMLAAEGNYDRLEKELETGTAPVDILIHLAASENDAPKVAELLRAGASTDVKDSRGKVAMDLTTSDEVKDLLQNREKADDF